MCRSAVQMAYLEVQAGGRVVGVVLLQLDGRLGVDGGHAGCVLHPIQGDGPPHLHLKFISVSLTTPVDTALSSNHTACKDEGHAGWGALGQTVLPNLCPFSKWVTEIVELACTREASRGKPVRQSKPASTTCSISTSLATLPASFTPRLRYLHAQSHFCAEIPSQMTPSEAAAQSLAVQRHMTATITLVRHCAAMATHMARGMPCQACMRGHTGIAGAAYRVPAKWRERRAMRVTVSAWPRTARLRRCQKPCTSGVTHRSFPNAALNRL